MTTGTDGTARGTRLDELLERAAGDALLLVDGGPDVMIGVNEFSPGEAFANHVHDRCRETFVGLRGVVDVWVDRRLARRIGPGEVCVVEPRREHYLVNSAGSSSAIAYIKAPHDPADRRDVPWTPDE